MKENEISEEEFRNALDVLRKIENPDILMHLSKAFESLAYCNRICDELIQSKKRRGR